MGECQSNTCCEADAARADYEAMATKTNPGMISRSNNESRVVETGGGGEGREGLRTIKFENGSVYNGELKNGNIRDGYGV